jgi:hypothetical protein
MDAPLLNCIREMNDRPSAAPQAGTILPGTLTPETNHWQGGVDNRYSASWSTKRTPAALPAHCWKSWIVTSPETADYTVTLHAAGGPVELRVDDHMLASSDEGGPITSRVTLTAGVHAVKVHSHEQTCEIAKITIEKVSQR